MNSAEIDAAHEHYMQIAQVLKEVCNTEIAKRKLTAESEEYVRQLLTETMRFWKDY